jgi:hypothetical protein
MASGRRNLYLYLTLVCFLSLIAIFIIDGYMGIYDTVYLTTGEIEQKIEADVWLRGEKYWTAGVKRGDKAFFRYEVDNRQFSSYSADVEASVWRSQEKMSDLGTYQVSIEAFGKKEVQWEVNTAGLIPAGAPPEQSYEYTVIIKRGGIERNIILYINPAPYPIKPIPVPPR